MRISTNQIYERGVTSMLAQQERAMKLQNELSSGMKVNTPSDDPIAFAQIELMNQRINTAEIHQKNISDVAGTLNNEDGVLGAIIDNIQSVQELQVQSGNGALTAEDRKSLATQAQGVLDQLITYANAKGLTGEYIFSGSRANNPAVSRSFDSSNNTYSYSFDGDDKRRYQAISDSLQVAVNDTADKLFMNIPAGNGDFSIKQTANPNNGAVVVTGSMVVDRSSYIPGDYTISISGNTVNITDSDNNNVLTTPYISGNTISFNGMSMTLSGEAADGQTFAISSGDKESLFSTVQSLIDNLKAPFDSAADKAAYNQKNSQISMQLNHALSSVTNHRTDLGGRLNQLDSVKNTTDNLVLISKEALKSLQESDPIEVAVQYNLQLVNLQAAQQSFVRIQGLSVFNYIG